MSRHDIGIVIVNYNVRHFLVQCLQSIRQSKTNNLNIEVWVVDNASVDGSVSLIQQEFPDINLIANKDNKGFSMANNQAMRLLDAKYVLLLNPDTVLEEDTLQLSYDFMQLHQDCGALGVRMIDGTGKFLPESKRKVPDLWSSFCKLTYLSDLFPQSRVFSGYNLGYLPEDEVNEIEVLCGAYMFMRSSVLKEVGLLDEAFFMYGEDIDLSYRIIKAGYKIFYYPKTSIIHYKGESTKKGSLNYVRTFYGAMHIYVNKHFGTGNAKVFATIINLAISLRAIISALSRVLQNWFWPLFDALIVWLAMVKIKFAWADFYFQNQFYYKDTNINQTIAIYAVIWITGMYVASHYDGTKSWGKSIVGVLSGTMVILVGYALLPEFLRTSRAIILIGAFLALMFAQVSLLLRNMLGGRAAHVASEPSNIAVVATKSSAEKLIHTLQKAKIDYNNVYVISPNEDDLDAYYTNTINALHKVVHDLKIDEVIYSNENLTMKQIIQSMTAMGNIVAFKIGSDDSMSIIGSNSKNRQGEFYSLDISYALDSTTWQRYKRLLDVVLSIIILLLSPILWVFCNFKIRLFSNILGVLVAKKTWIGYGGAYDDYGFLPPLSPAVIKAPLITKMLLYTEDHFKNANIAYAKDYGFMTDLSIIFENLYKLSNK